MANTTSAKNKYWFLGEGPCATRRPAPPPGPRSRKPKRPIKAKAPDATAALQSGQSALDKAAKTGIIHPRNAARKKSRLAKKLSASKTV